MSERPRPLNSEEITTNFTEELQTTPVPDQEEDHAHHWLIETPNGPTSAGSCKHCGAIYEEFRNSLPDEPYTTTSERAFNA